MKGFKQLTLKGVLKKHKSNPQDKFLHTKIETKGIKKSAFNKLQDYCSLGEIEANCRLFKITTHSGSDNALFRLIPADASF